MTAKPKPTVNEQPKLSLSATQKAAALAGSVAVSAFPFQTADAAVTIANGVPSLTVPTDGPMYHWDVDNDGAIDFLLLSSEGSVYFGSRSTYGSALNGRGMVQTTEMNAQDVVNLFSQVAGGTFSIGPTLADGYQFGAQSTLDRTIATESGGAGVNFVGGNGSSSDNYIGFRFESGGNLHYGWAQLELGSATLTRAYFQSTPNTPIILGAVPEPSSLGLLGLGIAGLGLMRRRKAA